MVRTMVEMLLGEWGTQLLVFVEKNALYIYPFIIIYGLIVFLSWQNLVRIYRFLIVGTAKQIHLSEEMDRKTTIKQTLTEVEIPWQEAVDASPFPLLARLGAIVPKKKTVEALKIYFDEKEIAEKAHEALKGADIRKMAPISRKILNREMEYKKQKSAEKDLTE